MPAYTEVEPTSERARYARKTVLERFDISRIIGKTINIIGAHDRARARRDDVVLFVSNNHAISEPLWESTVNA